MAKFIVGVLVGLFLGASATAYGAVATGSGTLSSWSINQSSIVAMSQTHLRRYPAFVIELFGKEQLRLPRVKHKHSFGGPIKLKFDPALMASYREATRQYKTG
jgi:hypothetical protein